MSGDPRGGPARLPCHHACRGHRPRNGEVVCRARVHRGRDGTRPRERQRPHPPGVAALRRGGRESNDGFREGARPRPGARRRPRVWPSASKSEKVVMGMPAACSARSWKRGRSHPSRRRSTSVCSSRKAGPTMPSPPALRSWPRGIHRRSRSAPPASSSPKRTSNAASSPRRSTPRPARIRCSLRFSTPNDTAPRSTATSPASPGAARGDAGRPRRGRAGGVHRRYAAGWVDAHRTDHPRPSGSVRRGRDGHD